MGQKPAGQWMDRLRGCCGGRGTAPGAVSVRAWIDDEGDTRTGSGDRVFSKGPDALSPFVCVFGELT